MNPTACRNCGSENLEWDSAAHSNMGPDGLAVRMSCVSVKFFLACKECSETLRIIDADSDEARRMLNPPKQLGKFLGEMPMTADGCCFGTGAMAYGPSPVKNDNRIIAYMVLIGNNLVSDGDRYEQQLSKCYSTYAAAERAYSPNIARKG